MVFSRLSYKIMTDPLPDKVAGTAHDLIGQGKAAVGEATGNERLQAEGVAEQAQGNAEKLVGDVKQGAHNLGEELKAGVGNLLDNAENALHNVNQPTR